jgi:hypothetical protein
MSNNNDDGALFKQTVIFGIIAAGVIALVVVAS